MNKVLITGSSGLVGSACVRHFDALGWTVHGFDNNARRSYFGSDGDTLDNLVALHKAAPHFHHLHGDIRDAVDVAYIVEAYRPDLVIHAAAQPSHDWAAAHPFEDFEVNARGTLNVLEAVRRYAPGAAFVFLSTNKVYGDAPNAEEWVEHQTRWEHGTHFFDDWLGFDETLPLDQSLHSLFGCSKLAADLYTQEYGRYYGLKTVCFRCGCLTGAAHAGAEQHGFLAYLVRCCKEGRSYTVHGYQGKQVRDQLHAVDVARACEEFWKNPKSGAVYNLGGGRANSVSVLEAIELVGKVSGKWLNWSYQDTPRKGDHQVWITDCTKFLTDYPGWSVTRPLGDILAELCGTTGGTHAPVL